MQQPFKRQPPSATSRQSQVVMGQGVITPAVREHLARRDDRPVAPTSPAPRRVVTMGQGVITPAVSQHLARSAKR